MTKNILILIAFVLVASTSNWAPVYTDVTLTGQGTEDSPLKVDTSRVATAYDLTTTAGGASYDVYTALLTQTGTSAPTATVLENTLGGTVVWSYTGVGDYAGTLTGAFPALKTIVMYDPFSAFGGDGVLYCKRQDDDYVFVQTKYNGWDGVFPSASNDMLTSSYIEIRVYP